MRKRGKKGRIGEAGDESTDLSITTATIPSYFRCRNNSHISRFPILSTGIYMGMLFDFDKNRNLIRNICVLDLILSL